MRTSLLLFLLLPFTSLFAQDPVTGSVFDEEGMPLIGVAILQAGTTRGAVTNLDGRFSIPVADKDSVELLFSYTGYETLRRKAIAGQKLESVVLNASINMLDEVVVTALGVSKKKVAMGYATSALAGRVAGAEVSAGRRNKRQFGRPIRGRALKAEPNRERYNKITENAFLKTKDEAISTLSTDVDRAAYANVRRFLNQGSLPPKDAVRTEELINYFNYDDTAPKTKNDVALTAETMVCPWAPKHRLLRINAKAIPITKDSVPASNLVFLIDVSGSMNSPDKLGLVKESFRMLVEELRPEDLISIVVYAGASGLVLAPTRASEREKILSALDRLTSGGGTAGAAGIELAYRTAEANFIPSGNNRVVLATDGDFNIGTSSQKALVKLIEGKRKSGVFLSVLGFGTGNYNEGTMQELADRGNGNHAYIDCAAEARKVLVEEFGGTLFTVATDVKLQLEFNPKAVASYRLIGYENRLLETEDFNNDKKDAADMGAGHGVTVLYELIPAKTIDEHHQLGQLKLRYKEKVGKRSRLLTTSITTRVRTLEEASENLRWSAAVAEFAMLLTGSKHAGKADWRHCLSLAEGAAGPDEKGYRAEMIELVSKAENLANARR